MKWNGRGETKSKEIKGEKKTSSHISRINFSLLYISCIHVGKKNFMLNLNLKGLWVFFFCLKKVEKGRRKHLQFHHWSLFVPLFENRLLPRVRQFRVATVVFQIFHDPESHHQAFSALSAVRSLGNAVGCLDDIDLLPMLQAHPGYCTIYLQKVSRVMNLCSAWWNQRTCQFSYRVSRGLLNLLAWYYLLVFVTRCSPFF